MHSVGETPIHRAEHIHVRKSLPVERHLKTGTPLTHLVFAVNIGEIVAVGTLTDFLLAARRNIHTKIADTVAVLIYLAVETGVYIERDVGTASPSISRRM